ncbi:MAG: hypothetical protein VB081_10275 [Christensenella sp.]|uniref:hypothetical protein n=1 Tax=Christensenella sp. TaxID=1935934 RepID=UPI002B1FF230|nr:hypothetical protein [Christensenella sp.]MEA5003873.1 hypothetical protein [Christensenella sp.]
MKKSILGTLAIAVCSVFLLSACTPAPVPSAAPSEDELVLAAKGEITNIATSGDTTSITVDGTDTKSDASYKILVAHLSTETPLIENGNVSAYTDGALSRGDEVEIYLSPLTPVTASEPPQATPVKVVVTEREDDNAQAGAAETPDVKKEFDGTITEITPDNEYYLVYVKDDEDSEPLDDLIAVVSNDTIISSEKTESSGYKPEDLKVGQKVTVTTDGRMTFSIPPQASAQTVVIHDTEDK